MLVSFTVVLLLSAAVSSGATGQAAQTLTADNYQILPNDNLEEVPWWQKWPRDNDRNKIDDVIDSIRENVELVKVKAASYIISGEYLDVRASLLIDFGRPIDENDIEALSGVVDPSNIFRFRYVNAVSIRDVRPEVAENLSKLGGVVMVELQQKVRAFLDVSSRAVKARPSTQYPDVWEELGVDGTGVNVAILDTGVDDEHESLSGKYVAGVDCTGSIDIEINPDDESEYDVFHGTHVAGIVMGSGGASGDYMGVAPGAGLVDVRVLNEKGEGTSESVIRGIEWCIANKDEHNIRILNLSLGTDSNSNGGDAQSQAVNAAVEQGLVVVAAVGNNGEDGFITSPGAADGAISVGALFDHNTVNRGDDTVASYSNSGPRLDDEDLDFYDELKPDVSAPGTYIWSAKGSNGVASNEYHQLSGTSMATPHVAGVVALMLQANPNLTPEEVKQILHETSEARGVPYDPSLSNKYSTGFGWGIIDAYAAVRVAMENFGPPDFSITSEDISFSDNTPVRGQKILVTARVHNEGGYGGTCDVAFYREGILTIPIGKVTGVRIEAGEVGYVKKTLNCAIIGEHTLSIVIENSSPSEDDVSNNRASKKITVWDSPVEPDLTLMEYDIYFPRMVLEAASVQPIAHGGISELELVLKPLTMPIGAVIHNVGLTDATCDVKFYFDQKIPENLIDNFSGVFVPSMDENRLQTTWIIPKDFYGEHTIYVVIENSDPPEEDLLNNEAGRGLSLPSRMEKGDVAISDSDITFSDNEPEEGCRINVNAIVHNVGVIDVENVKVALYVDNLPVGLGIISLIEQGSENSTSIEWGAEGGEHVIEIRVSLEGVEESNYGNNTAYSSIFVKEAGWFLLLAVLVVVIVSIAVALVAIKRRQ